MAQSSSERAWASRFRRKPAAAQTPEERERFKAYQRSLGQAGRPRLTSIPAAPAPAAPAASDAAQEPPAPSIPPESGAGGQGGSGGPPIDLGAAPAASNDNGPTSGAAEDAAAARAVERAQLIGFLAGYITQGLRACEPVIREAELPVPPLPELALVVVEQAWRITLDKWLPAEMGDPREHAELVACGASGYQLCLGYWAGKRLKARELEVTATPVPPAPAPAAAAPPKPAAAPAPASSPPAKPLPPLQQTNIFGSGGKS